MRLAFSSVLLGACLLGSALPDADAASWRGQSGRHWVPLAADGERTRGSGQRTDRREARPDPRDRPRDAGRSQRMTPNEREQLRRDLERANRDIYRKPGR